jgi:hypothetical protein
MSTSDARLTRALIQREVIPDKSTVGGRTAAFPVASGVTVGLAVL